MRFGIETSYSDGSPAPLGLLGDAITVDSKTGEVKISYFKGDRLAPQRGSLRVRVVAERIAESGEPPKPTIERYASNYIPLVTLDEDGTPIKGEIQKWKIKSPSKHVLTGDNPYFCRR